MKQKYQLFIYKCENVSLKYYDVPGAFTEYSSNVSDVCKDTDEYNIGKR